MVSIFGLSMVGILAAVSRSSSWLLAQGCWSSIGEGPFNGELRMSSYDYPYLVDGLKLVIVGLGIFAIPEIVALLRKDQAIADRPVLGSGYFRAQRLVAKQMAVDALCCDRCCCRRYSRAWWFCR